MITLNSYITEKLKINKEVHKAEIPNNKEEFIDFINTYYEEWYFSDPRQKDNERARKFFNQGKQELIDYTNDKYFSVPQAFQTKLPYLFIKYMNKKYNLGYKLNN